jgi:UDPglucose--hexose-1-phosphate uridylyltransferase
MLTEEREQRIRIVAERDGLVLLCPFAGRQPYELLVAPEDCEEDAFASAKLGAALELVADGLRRLRVAEENVAANAWVHSRGHWHIEVLPRLTTLAGLELGAGYYVNTLAPESAAGLLRGA